jgi:hypothetical protein
MRVPHPRGSARSMRGVTATQGLTRSRTAVAASMCAALAVLAGPSASASLPVERTHHKATVYKVTVPHSYFGVHDRYLSSLSHRSTGSIRVWDAGTSWDSMQPSESVPIDFSVLDNVVARAWANHTDVTFVAAMTPSWALASPVPAGSTFAANTYPPAVAAYAGFLKQVMAHYSDYRGSGRPGIVNYQVWNEANITTFWNGSMPQLAELVRAAYDVRRTTDTQTRIIAPAMVTRLKFEQKRIQSFYQTKVPSTGRPVWAYVNAISLSMYPTVTMPTSRGGTRPSTPEDAITLLNDVRARLKTAGVPRSLPIWDTEINYGMGSGPTTAPIPEAKQVAYVMRTYLLNAAQGVKRVNWYAYDLGTLPGGGTLGNTLLTDPDNRQGGVLTAAGKAFTRVQTWMHGTMVGTTTKRPCIADRHGTYTCLIRYAHGVGRVYWNPYRTAKIKMVRSARHKTNEYGTTTAAHGGKRLKVTYRPILVKSKR